MTISGATPRATGAAAAHGGPADMHVLLLELMSEGFALCELIREENGAATDFLYLEANSTFAVMMGLPPQSLTGKLQREVSAELCSSLVETCAGAVRTGEAVSFEFSVPGGARWYRVRCVPRGDERFVLLSEDITREKRAQLAVDEFLATLAHELRTPLAAITLWTAALRSGSIPIDDFGRAIDAISHSAESQSRLLEGLLDFSRLQAGKLELMPTALSLDRAARSVLDMVRPTAAAKQISLALELPTGLTEIMLDGERLNQVLWNLLSNAIKFTPQGGHVRLALARRQDELVIEVSDDGEGIPEPFLPHVFEKFRQAHGQNTRDRRGLGIGLALTRQLIERQGGSIEAHSDGVGRGAKFRVCLPWLEPKGALLAAHGRLEDLESPLAGLTVLLVEDDLHTREGMIWVLGNAGAMVVAVGSASAALEALGINGTPQPNGSEAQAIPDVIISDLGLPGMSGYELIQQVTAAYGETGQSPPPACAISAHARDADRRRAIAAGFDRYAAKPIGPDELVEIAADLRDIRRTAA